jgi:uncharacterized protein
VKPPGRFPAARPHVLGIDDAPFDKKQSSPVPIVGVTMEGANLVEAVAIGAFPVDGEGATEYLAAWVAGLRTRPVLQAVMFGGITIAGLGLVDLPRLAELLGLPVLAVTRHDPRNSDLRQALAAAGLPHRLPLLERSPPAWQADEGIYVAHAGTKREAAGHLVGATLGKGRVPEPVRVAHLIGRALVSGESRGRV